MKKILTICLLCPFIIVFGQQANNDSQAKWRVSIAGGAGYLLPNYGRDKQGMETLGFEAKQVNDFYKDFKWGWQGNTDIYYLLNQHVGIGVKYSLFSTQASIGNTITFPPVSGYSDILLTANEKLYINYVGPALNIRSFINQQKTWLISSSISLGYTHYRDELELRESSFYMVLDSPYPVVTSSENIVVLAKGKAFGLDLSVGAEYFLIKNLSIGCDLGFFYSSCDNFKIKALGQSINSNDEDVDVTRVNASLGLHVYF